MWFLSIGSIVLGAFSLLALRNAAKAGVTTTLLILLLFAYRSYSASVISVAAVGVAALAFAVYTVRSQRDWKPITLFLNVTALVALAWPAVAAIAGWGSSNAVSGIGEREIRMISLENMTPEMRERIGHTPNIYYIIVDGYARADVLRDFYAYDNQPFLEFLDSQGFYVASEARSNYARTPLSLGSSLNFIHLNELVIRNGIQESTDVQSTSGLITYNSVCYFLKHFGYETYAIGSGFQHHNAFGTDYFIQPNAVLNQFENALLGMTPFHETARFFDFRNAYDFHRDALLFAFDELEKTASAKSPKFVFTHIICPHPPFVFGRDGSATEPDSPEFKFEDADGVVGPQMTAEEYRSRYRDQLHYLNTRLMGTIRALRSRDPEAIIILQSDHGPGSMMKWNSVEDTNMKERFSILNALYFPGGQIAVLYDTLTPVNTFRIVFNTYFGANYELLPDDSFYSLGVRPYTFYGMIFD